ncbi:MAG: ribbon-helix-helix protein, CopG family [Candidatus Bathyarchaeia archaeon]
MELIRMMQTISINLPLKYIQTLDELVSLGYFSNRSEAIRTAIAILIRDTLRSNFMLEELKKVKSRNEAVKNYLHGRDY